jgi:hypothetical protein
MYQRVDELSDLIKKIYLRKYKIYDKHIMNLIRNQDIYDINELLPNEFEYLINKLIHVVALEERKKKNKNLTNTFINQTNTLINQNIPQQKTNIPEKYEDPVTYTDVETGRNYKIYKKNTQQKKIIAEGIFRMNNRNERLPEYLSGILCTVNNLKTEMGPEWGYRIYIDDNFLRKNIIVINAQNKIKYNTNYAYKNEFSEEEEQKWKKLFEDRDEGFIFQKFLEQLNNIDYVEIYKVELLNKSLIDENGYPVGLIGTNYRFHASLDKDKDIVYMKDGDFGASSELAKKWKLFENSSKSITYYFFPWYKPPTHALVQYPFSVIAYFWGIKPKLVNHHYSFDDILEYFINFDDKIPEAFFDRKPSTTFKEKGSYGSDEIVLTDLIFSGFKTNDTKPFGQLYDFNTITLFYIIYTFLMSDNTKREQFKELLNDELKVLQQNINENKKVYDNKLKKWDTTDLDKLLFGDSDNKFCCILPLYNNIPNKYVTMLFYMAYNNTLYDMVEKTDNCELNIRNCYYTKLVEYMRYYDSQLENKLTDELINDAIFNHTFTNHSGWSPSDKLKQSMVPNDEKYLFNRYYNIKIHIPAFYDITNSNKEPFWGFISNVVKNARSLCNKHVEDIYKVFFEKPKTTFFQPLWGPSMEFEKKYDMCVTGKSLTLLGGNSDSYGSYGSYGSYSGYVNFNCDTGDYKVSIKRITNPRYNVYEKMNRPILYNNTIMSNNFANSVPKKIMGLSDITNELQKLVSFEIDNNLLNTNTILLNLLNKYTLSLDDKKIVEIVYKSTINPSFHAVTWKLFKCISENISNNFMLMDSGNALSFDEYNVGEYPWDDDIDIGFKTDENYTEYKEMMKKCLRKGLEVYVYKKIVVIPVGKWSDSNNMQNTKINTESEVDTYNKNNIWFIKVTFPLNKFIIIKEKLNIKQNYKFGTSVYDVIPWIDIFPFYNSAPNEYKYLYGNYTDNKVVFKTNTNQIKQINNCNVVVPENIQDAIKKYKERVNYNKKDKIYNHITGTSKTINYDNNNIQQFVKEYIENHNIIIKNDMNKINCEDFFTTISGGYYTKYLKYKNKYLQLKNNNIY